MSAGKLTYFVPVRSRGEPVQMAIAYGKVDMEMDLISMDEWAKRKAAKVAPFLPYITQTDGTIMLETDVIMKHIATLGGKFVIDANQDELMQISNGKPIQLCDPTYNLPDGGQGEREKAGWPDYDAWFEATAKVLADYAVRLGDGPFFAGATPGYAECMIWANLDNCFDIDKKRFTDIIGEEAVGKLTAFYDRFAALDGVKEYLARRLKLWGLPGSRAQPTTLSFIDSPFTTKVEFEAWASLPAEKKVEALKLAKLKLAKLR